MDNSLDKIKQEVLSCQKCELGKTRINPVVGEGHLNSSILFIGEAPGANEDATGRPFCGKAGQVLDELLSVAGIERADVYIANILKCRPPKNRNPHSQEIQVCCEYLDKQIEVIKPKIICCLGNFAATYILTKYGFKDRVYGIGKIHGKIFFYRSPTIAVKIVPMYHPASVTYNINMMKILQKDFNMLKNIPR
ncbi:MAG: uracil-DNA glycosylase [Candidatus Omnitrophica bacterium]|nr:uracil-DNA glycosylase [Candidatus Omnitrophota bacterium]